MSPATVVDVHCHIFNAQDLPIPQFARRVFLVDHPIGGALAEPLIAIVALIMDSGAPTAQTEIAELGKIADGSAEPEEYIQTFEHKRQIVQMALERFLRPGDIVVLGKSGVDFNLPFADRQDFVNELHARVHRKTAAEFRLPALDLGGLAGELILGGDDVLQFVPWALTFTNYRFEILRQLSELSPDGKSEIFFYVPAVVDFNNWLKGPDDVLPIQVTPLPQQAAVMGKISAMKNRSYAMHGYIGFDPWRQAVYQRDSRQRTLDPTITDAITKQGFMGVKLYPPMGFRAMGNGDSDLKPANEHFPPDLVQALGYSCGDLLDDALRVLYDWCIKEDVPIMAHCGRSNYSRPDFAERASPLFWKRVLNYTDARGTPYKALRLNLGHIGGTSEYAENKPGAGWMEIVVDMLGDPNYPNLYADFAYDSLALERNSDEVTNDGKVMSFLKQTLPGTNALSKIMYGSDWIMLGLEFGNERYYSAVKKHFRDILGSDILLNGFLTRNAANFLGLPIQAGKKLKPRQRLEEFYQANGLDFSALKPFL